MVAVQVTVCLTLLMGVAALMIDGGLLLAERRHAQATADAAALAGAVDLFKNYRTNAGTDPSGSASASASAIATANYSANPANLAVTVHIPPQNAVTSYYNGKSGYVEVSVTYNQARGFSGIWSSAPIPVRAHAVARGQWIKTDYAIITLDPDDRTEFSATGSGSVTVNGGSILVNSNAVDALKNTGSARVTATSIDVVGGYVGGGTFSPAPATGAAAVEDPLKWLSTPSPPLPGSIASVSLGGGKTQYTLTPGSYNGNGGPAFPSLNNGDVAILKQASTNSAGGIYYLYNGLSLSGASVSMDVLSYGGVMLYNASTSAPLSLTGSSSSGIIVSGLTGQVASTSAYKGLVYFQARNATQDVSITGNGTMTLDGTFYTPDAGLKITGSTSNPPSTIGSQYIAKGLTVSGSGAVIVNYNSTTVAPARSIMLVE